MKKLLAVLVLVPALALGQGIQRRPRTPEVALATAWINNTLSATVFVTGYVLPPDRGFTVTSLVAWITTVGGGGAGNTVIRVTDGTSNCDCTLPCATTDSTGVKRWACTGSCVYPPAAAITSSVTTAGCTTTQPGVKPITIVGNWN